MKNITRDKLIRAGAKAMLAKSYNAVGIQEVLSEVNVPKGSFYYYFNSKEDFGKEIIHYYGEQLAKSIQKSLSDTNVSPRERMVNYFSSLKSYFVNVGCNQGCLVAKLATEIADSSPSMRIALKQEFDKWAALFADCIREAQKTGEIAKEHDPESLAEFIYTSWEGALIRMQVNLDPSSIDNFMTYIFDRVIPKQTQ